MPDDVTTDTEPAGPPPDRDADLQRLRQSLLRPSRTQLLVAALLAAVGFASVTQVRTADVDDNYAGKRDAELVQLLNSLTVAGQRAEAELARLQRTKRDLQDTTSRREAAVALSQQEADNLDMLAGLVPVHGPGLRVTITETSAPVDVEILLDLIQELRSADAEAMEFNDQVRVVAQTYFDTGDGGILVDGELITSPYTLDVIGEPRTLAEALTFPFGPLDQLNDIGATADVSVEDDVVIESVREPGRPQYAQPDEGPR